MSFSSIDEFKASVQTGDLLWVNYPVVLSSSGEVVLDQTIKIKIYENSNTKDKSRLLSTMSIGSAWAFYVGETRDNKNNPIKGRVKVMVTTEDKQILLGWVQVIALQKVIND
jgi:hypothetical protein